MKTRKRSVYAIYKGDKFIDVGTISELAERRNTTEKVILCISPPSKRSKRKNKEKGLELIKLDDDEEND